MTSSVGQKREVENRFIWENRDVLRQKYGGQWVAIECESILAADGDRRLVSETARDAGVETPYVVYMSPVDAPSVFLGPVTLY